MRLWNYQLIPVLPNAMLVSQWRECIAIKRQWEKGTLKHRLVSYVMENKQAFYDYCHDIAEEMKKMNIKFQEKYLLEIFDFCENEIDYLILNKSIFKEHNDRYLKQCLYNLQEKADRGIITQEEWQKIEDKFGGYL